MECNDESADPRIERESAALELETHGGGIITLGKLLLWFDLILICFVLVGLRTGSYLFLWWAIAEGVLGVVLVWFGIQRRSEARKTLNSLAPIE